MQTPCAGGEDGSDDPEVPFAHLALYHQKLPQARVRELAGRDHQLDDDYRQRLETRSASETTAVGCHEDACEH
jgi:hypothetical protein